MRESARNFLIVGVVAAVLPFVVAGLMVAGEIPLAAGVLGLAALAVVVASEWRDGSGPDAE